MPSAATMSLGRLVTTIGRRRGKTNSPAFNRAIKQEINNRLVEAAMGHDFEELTRRDAFGLRKLDVAGLASLEQSGVLFPLPWNLARMRYVKITTDNTTASPTWFDLIEKSPEEIGNLRGGLGSVSSRPIHYAIVGRTAQYRSLAANSVLTATADSTANDSAVVSNRVVRVYYTRTDSQPGMESYADLEGTFSGAGIALDGTAKAGWPIERIRLPQGWKGTLSIKDASANEIVSLRSQEQPAAAEGAEGEWSRQLALLDRVPDVDYNGIFVWQAMPRELVDDHEMIPVSVAQWLIESVTASIIRTRERNPAAAEPFEREARKMLGLSAGSQKKRENNPQPVFPNILDATGMG